MNLNRQQPKTSYTIRLAVTLLSRIFTGEVTLGYKRFRTKRSKGREAILIGILPSLDEGEGHSLQIEAKTE
jgi:hypothetical protein